MFPHYGLIFTAEHAQTAHQHQAAAPFHQAWTLLDTHQPLTDFDKVTGTYVRKQTTDQAGQQGGAV